MNINSEYEKGNIPKNKAIFYSFLVADNKIKNYNRVLCSISGGSDSDVMLDLLSRVDEGRKVSYVFFDTGLEYQATKEHLKELEKKYNIEIKIIKPKKPIPTSCREFGQPFISKQISEYIERLQKHKFKWEDKEYEELIKEYPNCLTGIKWWCNKWGEGSQFNINRKKGLKEFMISNPPNFKISNKCCKYAKKNPVMDYIKKNSFDLNCYGVRKAEGGVRSTSYKNCFTDNRENDYKIDEYRPLFWYSDTDKANYDVFFNIDHSDCYKKYGLKRTGCCGCPFSRNFENELIIMKTYEPKLYNAATNIFKNSYEYTRKYKEFIKSNFSKKEIDGQESMFK